MVDEVKMQAKLDELAKRITDFGYSGGLVGHISYALVLVDGSGKLLLAAHAHDDGGNPTNASDILAMGLEAEMFGDYDEHDH